MRKVVLTSVVLAILTMVLLAVGPYLVSSSRYRDLIEEKLTSLFDARVTIEKFHFHLIPYPGYTIRGFGLISKQGLFQGLPILWAEKVRGSLSPFALAKGSIVTSVKATQVTIDYRFEGGVTNVGQALRLGKARPEESPDAGDGVVIRSVELGSARLNIFTGGHGGPYVVDGVDLMAENLSESTVGQLGPATFGTDIRMSGQLAGSAEPNISVAGQIFYDAERNEFSIRGLRCYLAGSQFVGDIAVNFGVEPAAFNVHVVTPAIVPQSVAPFNAWLGRGLPWGLTWQGAVAADVTASGTRDAFQLDAHLDATAAGISVGGLFSKGAGLPFKVVLPLFLQRGALIVREGSLLLGDDTIHVGGEIGLGPSGKVRLNINGKDLDSGALKLFVPKLAIFGVLEGAEVDVDAEGETGGEKTVAVNGDFKAARVVVAGFEITHVDGAFARSDGELSFPMFKGTYAGGNLAGHGAVKLGGTTDYSFDVVADNLDAVSIPCLKGAISGKTSVVAKATTSGIDPLTVESNLKVSGSIVVHKGSLTKIGVGEVFFGDALWNAVREVSGQTADEVTIGELRSESADIAELKASFDVSAGTLHVTELTWQGARYQVDMSATFDKEGLISGTGVVRVSKSVALRLFPATEAKGVLFDREGRLVVPVAVGGGLDSPSVNLDRTKFAALLEEKKKEESKIQGPPAKVIREEKIVKKTAPAAPPAGRGKAPAPAQRRAEGEKKVRAPVERRPPQRTEAEKAKEEELDADDILKVIIGK